MSRILRNRTVHYYFKEPDGPLPFYGTGRSITILRNRTVHYHFTEPDGPLPFLQEHATCPYLEPDQSTPRPQPNSWRSILILSSHLHLYLPSDLFLSDFSTKSLFAPLLPPMCATCLVWFILLDLLTCKTDYLCLRNSFPVCVTNILRMCYAGKIKW